jgi:hypothetical protein
MLINDSMDARPYPFIGEFIRDDGLRRLAVFDESAFPNFPTPDTEGLA